MLNKKLIVTSLLMAGLFVLSSCSLFNDDDLVFKNVYNPVEDLEPEEDPTAVKAGGVTGKTVASVGNALCFKNISYATDDSIINTYKATGANHNEYNVNAGEDYFGSKSLNNFDLYVPNSAKKNDNHVVVLFVHGGAWVSGLKTDVNPYVHEFANRGYITATIKYTLLKKEMNDASLSIFRNLDEIDACIKTIKSCLEELEFDTTKTSLVIGGASSGAHLSMLYSYSRGNQSALPIKFIIDAVGPVDIKPEGWKRFNSASDEVLDAGITYSAIETQRTNGNLGGLTIADGSSTPSVWNDYQTMRIANGMCGLPYTLEQVEATTDENKRDIVNPNEASTSMLKVGGGEDLLSVTYWINSVNKIPMICAYGGRDSVVGIAQYARLEHALDANSIEHEFFYFKNSDHTEITKAKDETNYNAFLNKIDQWCQSL